MVGLTENALWKYCIYAFVFLSVMGFSGLVENNAQAHMYLNSAETQCNGNDPSVLMCDDFEDGTWYEKNCDVANASGGLLQTDGWCGTIYADPISPTSAAICGGQGAGGTNCAATSGYLDGHRGNRNMADHSLGPDRTSYDELYFRYYIRTSTDTIWSGEKLLTFNKCCAGGGGIDFTCAATGQSGAGANNTAEYNIVDAGSDTWKTQNQGNNLGVAANNRWYYVELHVRLNTPGVSNGIWEVWMNDCGTSGVCGGAPTLRSRHTNIMYRASGNNSTIGTVWIENWGNNRPGASGGNDGTIGTHYYDQVVIATRPIGFIGSAASSDAIPPSAPGNLRVQ